jgi:hypothetical protein
MIPLVIPSKARDLYPHIERMEILRCAQDDILESACQ